MRTFCWWCCLLFVSGTLPRFALASSTCASDSSLQANRSKELQRIVRADQEDRRDPDRFFKDRRYQLRVLRRDVLRRQRVGAIFGEGCMSTAADFAAAALVYQHGTVPEHYFQTFLWSKAAVDRGDDSQRRLMGLGLDRFLVNSGRKQLFASQAHKQDDSPCWCLEQVEPSFTDDLRKAKGGWTLAEALSWIADLNKDQQTCAEPAQCSEKPLKATPPGTVPGFW